MKNFNDYLKENGGDQNKALAAFAADIRADEAQKAAIAAEKALAVKVSKEKGGVMVLGLNSFPVTFYADQWERLSVFMPTVLAYIKANRDAIRTIETAYKDRVKAETDAKAAASAA